jgi:outer membrane protein
MNKLSLVSLALAGMLASGAANAQFFGTVGGTNVNPQSDNGTLAGADASVNDAWSLTGSVGYKFTPNIFAQLGTALMPFDHEVSLDGLGTVASLSHRPTVLSLNYQFLAEGTVRPFIGVGYGWVSISDEKAEGALSGLDISASDSNGFTYGGGVDFFINEDFFIRADVSVLDFSTDVSVETLGDVGTADVDPLVFGLSLGYQF